MSFCFETIWSDFVRARNCLYRPFKAVSLPHCPATCALRNCCFNCRAWAVTKTMSVALLLRNNMKRNPCSVTISSGLRVHLHLPALDLTWNPVVVDLWCVITWCHIPPQTSTFSPAVLRHKLRANSKHRMTSFHQEEEGCREARLGYMPVGVRARI